MSNASSDVANVKTGSGVPRRNFTLGVAWLAPIGALVDAMVICLGGAFAAAVYNLVASGRAASAPDIGGISLMAAVTYVSLAFLTEFYAAGAGARGREAVSASLRLWAATIFFLALCAYLLKVGGDFSRGASLAFVLASGLGLVVKNAYWPRLLRRAMSDGLIFVTRVLVVRLHARERKRHGAFVLRKLRRNGLHPVASRDFEIGSEAILGSEFSDFVEKHVHSGDVREIVILAERAALDEIQSVMERLRQYPLPVRCVLDPITQDVVERKLTRVGGDMILAQYQREPFSAFEQAAKRVLDFVTAFVGLVALSPLMIVTAAAIKLDSRGPVLFRQRRRGYGGKPFLILKFRSMTVADDGAVVVQARRGDARVTRVGKWIRRTSLDELPQLWNVLAGDMSIVGPRPHALAHDDYYSRLIEEYASRHHAKPGLTGWAQVNGFRGETPQIESMQARVEKDIWYINNWSIWLDVMIILRTMWVVFRQKTAY